MVYGRSEGVEALMHPLPDPLQRVLRPRKWPPSARYLVPVLLLVALALLSALFL